MSSHREALRVAQLDVLELDTNVTDSLLTSLNNCFKYPLFGGKLDLRSSRLNPLIQTSLYGFITYYTLVDSGQTIGQKLLRLRFGNSDLAPLTLKQLRVLNACLVAIFLGKSLSSHPTSTLSLPRSKGLIGSVAKLLEVIFKATTLVNFVLFLYKGHYRSLLLRLLGIQTVHMDASPQQRQINTSFIRRDLVWRGFTESLIFILSMINVHKLRRKFKDIRAALYKTPQEDETTAVNLKFCAFCEKIAHLPHQGGECRLHVYCYYCVFRAKDNDANVSCPSCNKLIGNSIEPLTNQKHSKDPEHGV